MPIYHPGWKEKSGVFFWCFPVNLTGGWTYTDRALTLAKTELFQPSNGARKGVTKVSSRNVGDTANLN